MKEQMNVFLGSLVVEYHKLQGYHWYVKGPDFFQMHAKLEEYYDEIRDLVDDVAEAMLMEGLEPAATVREFLELSLIEEVPGTFRGSGDILDELLADFRVLLDAAKKVKRAAEQAGSDLVSAKADGYIETLAKAVWMVSQSR